MKMDGIEIGCGCNVRKTEQIAMKVQMVPFKSRFIDK